MLFSRFYKCLCAKAVETFTGGQRFGRETTVQRGFKTQNKFAAELFCGQRFGQFMAVRSDFSGYGSRACELGPPKSARRWDHPRGHTVCLPA
jgi:hypothetical protein